MVAVRSEQYRLRHDLGDERAVHVCQSVSGGLVLWHFAAKVRGKSAFATQAPVPRS
jgi:hypothetical protein